MHRMSTYRTLWRTAVGAFTVLGAGLAFLFLPTHTLIGIGVLVAVPGGVIAAAVHTRTRTRTDNDTDVPPPRYLVKGAGLAALGVIAALGLIAVFGAAALLTLGLLAVGAPAVLRPLLAHVPHARTSTTVTPLPPPPPAASVPMDCQVFTDAELCWRWRTSFAVLQYTLAPAERLHIVQTRSALLDELARRNPEGFTRWLGSGARAASDPARYFTGAHQQPPHQQPPHQQPPHQQPPHEPPAVAQ